MTSEQALRTVRFMSDLTATVEGRAALAQLEADAAELQKFRRQKAGLCTCSKPNPGPNLIACQSCGCTL